MNGQSPCLKSESRGVTAARPTLSCRSTLCHGKECLFSNDGTSVCFLNLKFPVVNSLPSKATYGRFRSAIQYAKISKISDSWVAVSGLFFRTVVKCFE